MGGSPIFYLWISVNRREQELEQLLAPTVEGLGCQLWGVEYFPRGKRSMLRVYIDAPEGVTVDDSPLYCFRKYVAK